MNVACTNPNRDHVSKVPVSMQPVPLPLALKEHKQAAASYQGNHLLLSRVNPCTDVNYLYILVCTESPTSSWSTRLGCLHMNYNLPMSAGAAQNLGRMLPVAAYSAAPNDILSLNRDTLHISWNTISHSGGLSFLTTTTSQLERTHICTSCLSSESNLASI